MATNADDTADLDAEEDLKQAKESDTTKVEEEAQEVTNDDQSKDESQDSDLTTESSESSDDDHDKEWYKKAYQESTKEALRLKALADNPPPPQELRQSDDIDNLTPEQLYIRQKQDEEIAEAFARVQEDYPQVKDESDYKRFTNMAQSVGKNIKDAEKRLAPPREVYAKTITMLGWDRDDSKEKLGAALKEGATSTRTGVASSPPKSKVSDAMIAANLKMFPDKTRAEIIKELEPHII